KGHLSNNTLSNYKYTLTVINDYFPSTLIQSMTKQIYQEFLIDFGLTKSQETIDKVHAHIRACVREAVDEEIIDKDFTNNTVAVSKLAAKEDSEKHLNYNETKILLN